MSIILQTCLEYNNKIKVNFYEEFIQNIAVTTLTVF